MSHKPAYGGNLKKKAEPSKVLESPILGLFHFILATWSAGYDAGKRNGMKQTTTSSSVPVSPETNIGRGARRKPGSRAGTKK